VQLPAELIRTVRVCEESGGGLAFDATFGTDATVMRADLIESREKLFFSMQPSG